MTIQGTFGRHEAATFGAATFIDLRGVQWRRPAPQEARAEAGQGADAAGLFISCRGQWAGAEAAIAPAEATATADPATLIARYLEADCFRFAPRGTGQARR